MGPVSTCPDLAGLASTRVDILRVADANNFDRRDILLVRHAEKAPGRFDAGLSELGVRQATGLAARVRLWKPQALFTSPLRRARETASFVAQSCSLGAIERGDLTERKVNPAPGTGTPGFKSEWAKVEADRSYSAYGGESSRQAAARMLKAVNEISQTTNATQIVVITHGGIIRDFALSIGESESDRVGASAVPADLSSNSIGYCSLTLASVSQSGVVSLHFVARPYVQVPFGEQET